PTVATAAIGSVGVWSILVTLGLPVLGLLAIAASDTIGAGPYVYIGVVGLAVLVAMVVVFWLIMRSEPLARRLGRWGNAVVRPVAARTRRGKALDLVPVVLKLRNDLVDLVRRRWASITGAQVGVSFCQFLILFASLRGVEQTDPKTSFL